MPDTGTCTRDDLRTPANVWIVNVNDARLRVCVWQSEAKRLTDIAKSEVRHFFGDKEYDLCLPPIGTRLEEGE